MNMSPHNFVIIDFLGGLNFWWKSAAGTPKDDLNLNQNKTKKIPEIKPVWDFFFVNCQKNALC